MPETIVGKLGETVVPSRHYHCNNRCIGYQKNLFDCNGTRTHSHLNHKEALNHLTKQILLSIFVCKGNHCIKIETNVTKSAKNYNVKCIKEINVALSENP